VALAVKRGRRKNNAVSTFSAAHHYPSAGEPLLEVRGLSRTFRVPWHGDESASWLRRLLFRRTKDIVAVDDVSFSIARGERVGFLGGNGAGKTTTLKMLSGLLLPTRGTVRVGGVDPFAKSPAFLRRIALVMGNKQQLLWDLPARETFRLNGAIYGVDEAVLHQRIAELADLLQLTSLLDQPVRKLSLGERMKAELLASLLHAPEVLFLDEPTLGLDINAQVAVREFLRRYNEATGATILLTSHYMADITALCDRVLVINQGRLVFDGDLRALALRFEPRKEVRLELPAPVTAADVAAVVQDGVLHTGTDGRVVRFSVAPAQVSAALVRALVALKPVDVLVTDPPIDELVGRFLRGDAGSLPSLPPATTTTTAHQGPPAEASA
jgi:ABC-2 type transport system ATP-binding protein